jgi:hypothetical protein
MFLKDMCNAQALSGDTGKIYMVNIRFFGLNIDYFCFR